MASQIHLALGRADRGFRKRIGLRRRPRTRSRVPVQDLENSATTPKTAELDADVWGLLAVPIVGLRSHNAGAGALAKLEHVCREGPTLDSQQYLQQITSVHGSFNERLDYIYDTIVYICKEQQVACTFLPRSSSIPTSPKVRLLLTASPE